MRDAPGKRGEKMARRLADQLGTEVEVRPKISRQKEIAKQLKVLRKLGAFDLEASGEEEDFLEPSDPDSGGDRGRMDAPAQRREKEPKGPKGLKGPKEPKDQGWSWHQREEERKQETRDRDEGRKKFQAHIDFFPGGQLEESRGDTPSDIYASGAQWAERQRQDLRQEKRQDLRQRDFDCPYGQPQVAVALVKCESHSRVARAGALSRLFQSPFYALWESRGAAEETEGERLREALAWARGQHPGLPVLVVKDSSLSNLSPAQLEEKVALALDSAREADICYLGRWEDKCQQQRRMKGRADSALSWTYGPAGLQAALFFPSGRDAVLGLRPGRGGEIFRLEGEAGAALAQHIERGNLRAACFSPNLVEYDLALATRDEDYNRRNECVPLERQCSRRRGGEPKSLVEGDFLSTPAWVWAAILLFVVFAVAILVAIAR